MTLKQKYEDWKAKRPTMIFDEEGDADFAKLYFGETVGVFCRNMMRELMEIEHRLDQLEGNKPATYDD